MTSNRTEESFTASFVEGESSVRLELMNTTELTLKCVEVLTVFLKDEETPGGGPSRAHIKFEAVKSIQPQEKVVLSHRTWIDGKPAAARSRAGATQNSRWAELDLTCWIFPGRTR